MTISEIREILSTIRAVCVVRSLDIETHELGLEMAERYGFSIYDGLIVAAQCVPEVPRVAAGGELFDRQPPICLRITYCRYRWSPSLVPPSPAVPTAAENQKYNDDDQNCCAVHVALPETPKYHSDQIDNSMPLPASKRSRAATGTDGSPRSCVHRPLWVDGYGVRPANTKFAGRLNRSRHFAN